MRKIDIENVVIGFISGINGSDTIVNTFTSGYCYYFAIILQERFKDYGGDIYYNQIDNHFAYFLNGHIYDITGDITSSISMYVPWKIYQMVEPLDAMNVARDCIQKYNTTKEELLEARDRRLHITNDVKQEQQIDTTVKQKPADLPF